MIYQKLLEFQKLGISIKKNSVNPHFKNEYADLNEVLDKVKKPLNQLGVVIVQTPTADGLATCLYDTSDDTTLASLIPYINATDMQKLGGAITYAKRYALIAMLALEDDDDDGNKASVKSEKKTYPPVTSNDDLDLDI